MRAAFAEHDEQPREAQKIIHHTLLRGSVFSVSGDSGLCTGATADGVATADAALASLLVRDTNIHTNIYITRGPNTGRARGGRGKMPGKAKGPGGRARGRAGTLALRRIDRAHASAPRVRSAKPKANSDRTPELSNFLHFHTLACPHSNFVVKLSRLSGVSAEAGPRQGRLALLSPPHNYQG